MKKALLSWLFILISYFAIGQTASVEGTVNSSDGSPLEGASVNIMGTNLQTTSDANGLFNIVNVTPGEYQILVTAAGYDNYFSKNFTVEAGKTVNVGILKINSLGTAVLSEGVTVVNADNLNSDQGSENVSALLHGSRDVFLNAVSFSLSPMRFKSRGYEDEYTEVSINGVNMSNLETGNTYWSNWGGLNNVTKNSIISYGLDESDNSIGNIGGTTDILMIPSKVRKGVNITYASTNRSYRNRAMFTYSSGLMPKNWAVTISGSRRWAEEGYVEGTFYDGWSYYMGVEKRFENQSIYLNVFGAYTKRGKQGSSTQEMYDLVDNNYYNPYWGWQSGEKRNSRVGTDHLPTAVLTHDCNISEKTNLISTIVARTGRGGSTSLNWYNAADPRPDYYRNLPSYITNPEQAEFTANAIGTDSTYSQINWSEIYETNLNSYEEITDVDGIAGNTVKGNYAQYIIEERRYDQIFAGFNTTLSHEFNDYLKLNTGFQYRYFVGQNYKLVNDLLGGDFWLDIDKYAERDLGDPDSIQSNLLTPNHIVKAGDVFGYNYNSNVREGEYFAQITLDTKWITYFLAGNVSYTSMWRDGKMKNGIFPDESYGKSKVYNFLDFGGKTGFIFKINGRNFIQGHAAYFTLAPTFQNIFISPRTRDHVIENPVSEKVMSGDIGYTLRAPRLKASLTFFYTEFKDQIRNMSFYHDGYRNFVNYAMSGINKKHQGIEFGIDATIITDLNLYAVTSLGYYRYTSRPTVNITIDNSAIPLAEDKIVYANGFLVSGTPQTAGVVGIKWKAPKFWFFDVSANYIDDIYLDFNPERRTAEAVEYVVPGTDLWNNIVNQVELPGGYTIDASIGKSISIKRKYFININLSVNNILNNKSIITGGYEQLRYDVEDKNPDKYPAKYYYMYGRQYYLNLGFRF